MNKQIAELLDEQAELQIAPLIDMVFLLLIYFMVSASLIKKEADLGITLPGKIAQAQAVTMPDEQIIEIQENGDVVLNSRVFGSPDSPDLPELEETMTKFRLAAEAAKTKAMVTIQADGEVEHRRVIDVMNACAGAGIEHVTFGTGEGS